MTPPVLGELPKIGPAVVTIGVFDGVHLGHRQLVRETERAAMERAAASVALVLTPHPDEVMRPGTRVPRLLPPDETVARLAGAGIDHVVRVTFDEAVRALAPEDFLQALGPAIELRAVVMGEGTAFGAHRAGTPDRVAEVGAERGFDLIRVEPLLLDGEPVSSTRVRHALRDGELELVRRLLDAPALLRGVVIRGDGRGRELGFPTANLEFDYAAALPALGIYMGLVTAPERGVGPRHPALVSVGTRPTFHDDARVLVEAYLLDWDGDLYGAQLDVELVDRLRDERRFESAEALVTQMRQDESEARRRIGSESASSGPMAARGALW